MKELCWEAGRPRWVFVGTVAGGAGIHGCLEMGCSVVALCFDEHHRTHVQKFLKERAVEAMVSGSSNVFKDDALQARSATLKLTTPTKPAADDEDDEEKKNVIQAARKRKLAEAKKGANKPKASTPKKKTKDDEEDEDDEEDDQEDDEEDDEEEIEAAPASKKKNKKAV